MIKRARPRPRVAPRSRCKRCAQGPPPPSSLDWIDTPARLLASWPTWANVGPTLVARLHMHLRLRRTRRPAFRRVEWAGAGESRRSEAGVAPMPGALGLSDDQP